MFKDPPKRPCKTSVEIASHGFAKFLENQVLPHPSLEDVSDLISIPVPREAKGGTACFFSELYLFAVPLGHTIISAAPQQSEICVKFSVFSHRF